MPELEPLSSMFDVEGGVAMPVPERLLRLYGPLLFPPHPAGPYVLSNFVTSLDGIISLNLPGQMGGAAISGHNSQDRMVMGLLRSLADVVLITSESLRVAAGRLWTAEDIFPPLTSDYQELRRRIDAAPAPLHVIITGRGDIDVRHRVFESGEVPSLVLTTSTGKRQARKLGLSAKIPILELEERGQLDAGEIIRATDDFATSCRLVLSEGGGHLLGTLLQADRLNELFQTLSPQLVGNDALIGRPSLVSGHVLAPESSRWGKLVSVKRGASHLFLRYRFDADKEPKS